jgi:hypothetical protein
VAALIFSALDINAEEAIAAATSKKAALEAAINAAEHYLKALRLAPADDKKLLDATSRVVSFRVDAGGRRLGKAFWGPARAADCQSVAALLESAAPGARRRQKATRRQMQGIDIQS